MSDLRTVERRIANLRMIKEIVHSMRALSAVQYRHASQGLNNLRIYADEFRRGLASLNVPLLAPFAPRKLVLIIIGSDQGLCGPLTARAVEKGLARASELADKLRGVVAIGRKTSELLRSRGTDPIEVHSAPTSDRGIDEVVGWIARVVGRLMDERRCDGAEVISTRLVASGESKPELIRVLPIDSEALKPPALGEARSSRPHERRHYERSDVIAASILREWTYIEVYRCALESLASEHDARLHTTDAATHALDRKLEDLRLEQNHLRQEAITEEILESSPSAEV